jgi:cyanophycinase
MSPDSHGARRGDPLDDGQHGPRETYVHRSASARDDGGRRAAAAGDDLPRDVGRDAPQETTVRRPSGSVRDEPPHVTGTRTARTSRPRIPVEQAGALVLIGGACSPKGEALGRFLELADARRGGRIVGLTTASSDPQRSAVLWRADFTTAGVTSAEIPVIGSRPDACDESIAARVRDADGVFLGGGDQVKLVATLSGTPVGTAIRQAWARGAVVCGTSAGAAALTELTLAGGEVDEEGALVEMYIGPGFGLLGYRALVDTHFGARRRLHRLVVAIANNPELLGLGIDEDTALVVHGHVGEVVGAGGVTFVDGRTMRFDDSDEVGLGKQRTMSHLRVGIVGPGHRLDLRERELAVLVDEGARVAD